MTQRANLRKERGARRLLRSDEVSVFIPLLMIMLVTALFRRDFLTIKNFSAMFTQIPFIAIVALGASFVLMTGNVDISTGRVAGFAGIIMSVLCVDAGWSAPAAIAVALASACLIGLFNGFLVVHMGVPDFVATAFAEYAGGLYAYGRVRSALSWNAAAFLDHARAVRDRVHRDQENALGAQTARVRR